MIVDLEAEKQWPNPISTKIEPLNTFYAAEEVHQKYLMKNPEGYTCHFIRKR